MDSPTNVVRLRQPEDIDDPLTEVLRSGARRLLAQEVEMEAEAFLTAMQDLRLPDGRARLVRHGHGPERAIQTGIGPVQGSGRRRQRCEAALRLHGEGFSIKAIARALGASRNGVRRWLRAGAFVPYRRDPTPTRLDPHLPFVEARWRDGQHNAAALHRELRAIGFEGGYETVQRWAKRQRQGTGHDRPARPPSARIPSTRRIARWLTCDPASLALDDRRFVEALCGLAPRLQATAEQVRGFSAILRAGDPAALKPWLDAAATSELGGFAAGLRQDEAAVQAAIAEPWSNGPVEGQVNRLKLIKRPMYGRAGFDLLRQRVLHAA